MLGPLLSLRRTIVLVSLTVGACAPGLAQNTSWPPFMPSLQPSRSLSPLAAKLPDNLTVTPPVADVPAKAAAWSGKWTGWSGRNQSGDIRLVVESVTADGAMIVYGYADANLKEPFMARMPAKFVGDELHSALPGNTANIVYRMREPKVVEFKYDTGRQQVYGVMAKED